MIGKRFARDNDGSAAVEFAFVGPGLLLAITGVIEMSLAMFVGSMLESAVLQSSRFGITGSTPEGVSREAQVLQIVEDNTFGLVDMEEVNIETLVYPNFVDIGQPEPFTDGNGNATYDAGEPYTDINGNGQWDADMGAAGLGGPGDVVVYRISYTWGALTGLMEPIIGDITHTSSVAVRNEPF